MNNIITLDSQSPSIIHLCNRDKRFEKVFNMVGSISYASHSDPFVFIVHEIIEQMLSKQTGDKIFQRLIEKCEGTINVESIYALSPDEICEIGTSRQKAASIHELSHSIVSGKFDLMQVSLMDDLSAIKSLTSLKGVGTWTAKMYLIFVLDRQDILPFEDAAFLQGYKWLYKTNDIDKKSIVKKCKKWKPYSPIASRYMYKVVDMGLTKNEFHLFG